LKQIEYLKNKLKNKEETEMEEKKEFRLVVEGLQTKLFEAVISKRRLIDDHNKEMEDQEVILSNLREALDELVATNEKQEASLIEACGQIEFVVDEKNKLEKYLDEIRLIVLSELDLNSKKVIPSGEIIQLLATYLSEVKNKLMLHQQNNSEFEDVEKQKSLEEEKADEVMKKLKILEQQKDDFEKRMIKEEKMRIQIQEEDYRLKERLHQIMEEFEEMKEEMKIKNEMFEDLKIEKIKLEEELVRREGRFYTQRDVDKKSSEVEQIVRAENAEEVKKMKDQINEMKDQMEETRKNEEDREARFRRLVEDKEQIEDEKEEIMSDLKSCLKEVDELKMKDQKNIQELKIVKDHLEEFEKKMKSAEDEKNNLKIQLETLIKTSEQDQKMLKESHDQKEEERLKAIKSLAEVERSLIEARSQIGYLIKERSNIECQLKENKKDFDKYISCLMSEHKQRCKEMRSVKEIVEQLGRNDGGICKITTSMQQQITTQRAENDLMKGKIQKSKEKIESLIKEKKKIRKNFFKLLSKFEELEEELKETKRKLEDEVKISKKHQQTSDRLRCGLEQAILRHNQATCLFDQFTGINETSQKLILLEKKRSSDCLQILPKNTSPARLMMMTSHTPRDLSLNE